MLELLTESLVGTLLVNFLLSFSSRPFSINSLSLSSIASLLLETRVICIGGIFSSKADRKLL